MRRVSSLGIIGGMAIIAGCWQSGIASFVADGAIVGNRNMRTCKVGMCRVGSRLPVGSRGVTGCTILCKFAVGDFMAGIGRRIIVIDMTTGTGIRCSSISGGMAIFTGRGSMCPGQRECRFAVVETSIRITCRMAGITGIAVIFISVNTIMFTIGIPGTVFVAVGTGKLSIIGGIFMAVGTIIPFPFVISRIDRERTSVVILIAGRFPAWIQRMANLTGRGEIKRGMVRICGGCIIGLMAGHALGRKARKNAGSMASVAIADFVPSF